MVFSSDAAGVVARDAVAQFFRGRPHALLGESVVHQALVHEDGARHDHEYGRSHADRHRGRGGLGGHRYVPLTVQSGAVHHVLRDQGKQVQDLIVFRRSDDLR